MGLEREYQWKADSLIPGLALYFSLLTSHFELCGRFLFYFVYLRGPIIYVVSGR